MARRAKSADATEVAAEWVDPATLVPWTRNPRRNNDAAHDVMLAIVRFGFTAPIIARRADNRVIAGHTRLKAVGLLPAAWQEATPDERAKWHLGAAALAAASPHGRVPVRYVDCTEAEADALCLADNRTGELAEWDDGGLAQILCDLRGQDVPLDGLGWDQSAIDELLAAPVDVRAHQRNGPGEPETIEYDDVPDESDGLRAPFPWFGGKSRAAANVWAALGDVDNYIEPFAGSLAVLLRRPHTPRTETVNDADGFIVNFWRALQASPEAVAEHVDWPVTELDLTARHLWLIARRAEMTAKLEVDPAYCDAKIAGWWCWGLCCWIGSGWCSGTGPWVAGDDGIEHRKLPHLGDAGMGVHRKLPHLGNAGRGVHRKLPHLGDAGRGVHRQLPHLGNAGRGVHRQLPHLGNAGMGEEGTSVGAYLASIAARIRRCRITAGDWSRVVTGAVRRGPGGTCGVFLDPPYPEGFDPDGTYADGFDAAKVWRDVTTWAAENGNVDDLRIVVAGYEGSWTPPGDWTIRRWKPRKGYQASDVALENIRRDVLWCSPACLR